MPKNDTANREPEPCAAVRLGGMFRVHSNRLRRRQDAGVGGGSDCQRLRCDVHLRTFWWVVSSKVVLGRGCRVHWERKMSSNQGLLNLVRVFLRVSRRQFVVFYGF